MHDPATGRRPVETTGLNAVAIAQRIPVIDPGFRIEKEVGHRREAGMGMRLEGCLTHPGMIDTQKGVDRFGHLATP